MASDIDTLAEAATASSRAMAGELFGRIGVKRLIELWEQHNSDVQKWGKAVRAKHQCDIRFLLACIDELEAAGGESLDLEDAMIVQQIRAELAETPDDTTESEG